MARRGNFLSLAFLIAMGVLALVPAAAGADANQVLADWQMNEGSNASVMSDSSGNNIDGAIGSAVQTGVDHNGATVYRWSNTNPNQPPAKPERLIQVDNDDLNPGSDDYAVTVRFRTTRPFGNIIQKGQSTNLGGNWKWQIPKGKLVCVFDGADGKKAVNSGDPADPRFDPLNDGQWHTARCERRGDRVILTIDEGTPDERVRRGSGATGNIANNVPLTIGGKLNCTNLPGEATCDYFVGDIDYVKIETGPRGPSNLPPVAKAGVSCDYRKCDFTAAGSFDPDGSIAGYSWDFGDGTTGSAKDVSHTYAEPGTYEVTLLVSDDEGATDSDNLTVSPQSEPPAASFTVTCEFRECDFDAAGSDDPDGTIVDYEWDFGDATVGSGVTEAHTYAAPGTYTVRLTVTDNHGETDDTTRTANPESAPPVARFSIDCDTQACAFDGSSSFDPDGTIAAYKWDFGDGETATGPTPIHHFDEPGTYDVELTVTDNHGVAGVREKPAKAKWARKVYLHDLRPQPADLDGNKWIAKVVVKVRDTKGVPRAHAKIKAKMGNKNRTCYTNDAGKCTLKMKVTDTRPRLPVEVTKVIWPGGYKASANKDRDGDGNGATVTVWRPF